MSTKRWNAFLAIAIVCGGASLPCAAKPLVLAEKGVANAVIVVAPDAPPSTQYAAQELQRFLGEITGGTFSIVSDTAPVRRCEIIVGPNRHAKAVFGSKLDIASLGKEGYILRTKRSHLLIAGGEPRGTLYGVYGLLEDHLGCRWFTHVVSKIPKQDPLALETLDERVVPALEYREPFVMDCFDGDWAARNRMNSSSASLEERHGGKVTYFGFVHTFEGLLPPSQYFDAHPEYFSLVKGNRMKERSQLCCTNEDVIRLVTEEVRKRMREHPEATVFSVSQNDRFNFCECPRCTALAEAEGSQMAPVLALVNRVAQAAAQEFPDKLIDTLAYQYTRKPCKTLRPAPNVIIRLCSIECCFSHPFETCDSEDNRTFVEDVKGWAAMCNRLWVWNYDTSFSNYFTPFPNLRVRDDNTRFFVAHHVTGIFEQDVYTTMNGELSALSGYLGAKLLWNPEYGEDRAINEFLEAVYGQAAPPIRRYLDLIHDHVRDRNIHMNIWIGPQHPVLDDGILEQAIPIWDEAERAVENDPQVLEQVRVARLSVDFAQIERLREEGFGMYALNEQTGGLSLRPEFSALVKRFFDVAERNGVTQMREGNGAIAQYKEELAKYVDIPAAPLQKAVRVRHAKAGLRCKVYEGAWETLPDFATIKPVEEVLAPEVSLAATARREAFALEFDGYLLAPADGVYIFHLRSNDGSKLFLGDKELIDNNGSHKLATRSGIVSLKKGYHPIRVTYFEAGGEEGLDLFYEGPAIAKQRVPPAAFWHKK